MATLKASTFASRDDAEEHYLSMIDTHAANARHIDSAQADVYKQKLMEAREGCGELLELEAKELGMPLDVLVNAVLHQHEKRQLRSHHIELDRVKAKANIRKANTAAEMYEAVKEFKQQLTLLQ